MSDEDRVVVTTPFGEGSEECAESQTRFGRELGFPFPMNPFESPLKETLNAVVKGAFAGLEEAESATEDRRERDEQQQDLPPQEKEEKASDVGGLGAVVAQERGGRRRPQDDGEGREADAECREGLGNLSSGAVLAEERLGSLVLEPVMEPPGAGGFGGRGRGELIFRDEAAVDLAMSWVREGLVSLFRLKGVVEIHKIFQTPVGPFRVCCWRGHGDWVGRKQKREGARCLRVNVVDPDVF